MLIIIVAYRHSVIYTVRTFLKRKILMKEENHDDPVAGLQVDQTKIPHTTIHLTE